WFAREEQRRLAARRRRRRRMTNLLLSFVLAGATWGAIEIQRSVPDDDTTLAASSSVGQLIQAPSPSTEEQSAPLGQPPAVAWDGSPYTFLQTTTDERGVAVPVTWSPCRP